jgi:hypothetical protein
LSLARTSSLLNKWNVATVKTHLVVSMPAPTTLRASSVSLSRDLSELGYLESMMSWKMVGVGNISRLDVASLQNCSNLACDALNVMCW